MPEGFEEDEGDAIGEVERAGGGIEHGDAEPLILILFEEGLGKTGGFAAEHEVVVRSEGGFGVALRAIGFDEPEGAGWWKLRLEVGPVFVAMPGDVLPVIHAGAFELTVVELEAEGFDQVKSCAGGGAEAGDIAGVGRDFWFEQDDVHGS